MKLAAEFTNPEARAPGHLGSGASENMAPGGDPDQEEILEQILIALQNLVSERKTGICPDRLYTPDETADFLAIRSRRAAQTVSSIDTLAKVRVGPSGGMIRYRGADILAFIESRREV